MKKEEPTLKQVIEYMNILHLWFKDNALSLSEELDIKIERLSYTNSFFKKLLASKQIDIAASRTLSNLFQNTGKGNPRSENTKNKLKELVETLDIDIKKYKGKVFFKEYSEVKDKKLRINENYVFGGSSYNSNEYSRLKVDFLNNDEIIYNTIAKLILKNTKSSIKAVMNGGLGGKAPKDWHRKVFEFLKERHISSNPVTFDLIIILTKGDLSNTKDVGFLKKQLAILKTEGIESRFKVHLCIQNYVWVSPDFLMIDSNYLIFNWPTTLDKVTSADRTQKAFLISESFAAIQYFKDFFEKIIMAQGRCILAEEYLKENDL